MEFREAAVGVLSEIGSNTVEMKVRNLLDLSLKLDSSRGFARSLKLQELEEKNDLFERNQTYSNLFASLLFLRNRFLVGWVQLDENPLLTTAFLDLFTMYAQINLLVNSIEEKRLIMAVYYKLFNFIKATNEPNYQR